LGITYAFALKNTIPKDVQLFLITIPLRIKGRNPPLYGGQGILLSLPLYGGKGGRKIDKEVAERSVQNINLEKIYKSEVKMLT